MKIVSVVGARPNFMKIAPLKRAIDEFNSKDHSLFEHILVHTGQHYDENMSKVFFEDLELPEPDYYLGVGGGSHAEQTARIILAFEKILLKEIPDIVVVVGDVNSTMACSITAVKMGIKVAHVEAGLRSFDRTMPEEINRIITDSISDILFVSEPSGILNLNNEGIPADKVAFVGNIMIDSLIYYLNKNKNSSLLDRFKLKGNSYCLVTLHRPSNVDNKESIEKIINFLNDLSSKIKIFFPVHPRTYNNFIKYSLLNNLKDEIILSEPLGYLDFISALKEAKFVLTDSGGIQEESTFLGIPCITLRNTTERPVTVEVGSNYLAGENVEKAFEYAENILAGNYKNGKIPELWDGNTAQRIVNVLYEKLVRSL
ncbi:non-hydrolyzing UDP-N-acetylglucosamine 2-epimerase [Melioribacter sp. OK-6-Me]|uniref:non-hydrolyzing UDP-N-acetylglucosamine 2-epimerase n=1 Tax=Melioribacter sp. OK-6-Me TaxID=3423433 RepID=UPI003EDB1190